MNAIIKQYCYSIIPWLTPLYEQLHHSQYEAQIAVGAFESLFVCVLCGKVKMQSIRKFLAFQTSCLPLLCPTQQEMMLR